MSKITPEEKKEIERQMGEKEIVLDDDLYILPVPKETVRKVTRKSLLALLRVKAKKE